MYELVTVLGTLKDNINENVKKQEGAGVVDKRREDIMADINLFLHPFVWTNTNSGLVVKYKIIFFLLDVCSCYISLTFPSTCSKLPPRLQEVATSMSWQIWESRPRLLLDFPRQFISYSAATRNPRWFINGGTWNLLCYSLKIAKTWYFHRNSHFAIKACLPYLTATYDDAVPIGEINWASNSIQIQGTRSASSFMREPQFKPMVEGSIDEIAEVMRKYPDKEVWEFP